jgi:hypothetical protein
MLQPHESAGRSSRGSCEKDLLPAFSDASALHNIAPFPVTLKPT